jgi:energy-coupling factor transport system substrate-specific component
MTPSPQSWQLKDYVFAAFMGVGILLAAVITQGIAAVIPVPGIRTILWAPMAGVFLTLGMARLRKFGAVVLMVSPVGLLLGLINPLISLVLVVPALLTELIIFLTGGYRDTQRRWLGNVLYFELTLVVGIVFLVTGVTAAFGINIPNTIGLPILIGALIAGGTVATLGWWLGEQVVRQLQKAGKFDLDP